MEDLSQQPYQPLSNSELQGIGNSPQEQYQHVTPELQGSYIISQQTQGDGLKLPKNWMKITAFVFVTVVALSGTGAVLFTIKNTTQTLTKASEKQEAAINELLDEADKPNGSFGLVTKVKAEYKNPLKSSSDDTNPFATSKNPFDEIQP